MTLQEVQFCPFRISVAIFYQDGPHTQAPQVSDAFSKYVLREIGFPVSYLRSHLLETELQFMGGAILPL